jgi:hypothetical protein
MRDCGRFYYRPGGLFVRRRRAKPSKESAGRRFSSAPSRRGMPERTTFKGNA